VRRIDAGRSFSLAQWHFLLQALAGVPEPAARARLRCVLHLGYATGLRLAEPEAARAGEVRRQRLEQGSAETWILEVLGKGKRHREVPVPEAVIAALSEYLAHRGRALSGV